jgi:hypothetical protein
MSHAPASESNHRGGSHSGQWGLSAILIGGLVVFMFPIIVMSLFGAMTGAFHNEFLKSNDIDLGVSATYAMVFGLLILSIIAVGCAAIGVLSGLMRRQPMGLSISGMVLAVVAVVLAVILLLIAQRCIDWARDYQKQRFTVKLDFGR